MHRSSQGLFLPHAKFKQSEKAGSFFLHSSNLYVEKSKWIYIAETLFDGKQFLEIPASDKSFERIDEYIKLAKNAIKARFREE